MHFQAIFTRNYNFDIFCRAIKMKCKKRLGKLYFTSQITILFSQALRSYDEEPTSTTCLSLTSISKIGGEFQFKKQSKSSSKIQPLGVFFFIKSKKKKLKKKKLFQSLMALPHQ
jgi:hypothetical protein